MAFGGQEDLQAERQLEVQAQERRRQAWLSMQKVPPPICPFCCAWHASLECQSDLTAWARTCTVWTRALSAVNSQSVGILTARTVRIALASCHRKSQKLVSSASYKQVRPNRWIYF